MEPRLGISHLSEIQGNPGKHATESREYKSLGKRRCEGGNGAGGAAGGAIQGGEPFRGSLRREWSTWAPGGLEGLIVGRLSNHPKPPASRPPAGPPSHGKGRDTKARGGVDTEVRGHTPLAVGPARARGGGAVLGLTTEGKERMGIDFAC